MKGTTKRMKDKAYWEKIFAHHILNKGFVSRIYKEFSKPDKKARQLNKKCGKVEQTLH